jgi:hypothetical protein
LILAGLIAAGASGAVLVGRWLARRQRDDRGPEDAGAGDEAKGAGESRSGEPGGEVKDPPKKDEAGAKPRPRRPPPPDAKDVKLDGFPCQLGDVVMRITGEEAWLAGGLVLSEEVPVAALFVAPDAGHDCVLYVRPAPRDALYWLEPLDPSDVLVAGEPPSSVEHLGVRFDRTRRLPLRPRRIGVGAPDVGDAVVVAEYASAGAERLVVVKSATGAHAFRGVELEPSSFEVIPSGEATLDR